MEPSCGAGSATDIVGSTPLVVTELLPALQSYCILMGKLRWEAAREHVESFRGKRIPVTTSVEDSACHSLLSICIQLTQMEKTYFSLNFMLPKAFFRKENTLLLSYNHIKSELCRFVDMNSDNARSCTAEDLRRRFIDLVSARVSLMNVYNAFSINSLGLVSELCMLVNVLASVEEMLSVSRKHDCMTSLFELICGEARLLRLLLEVQLELLRCQWFILFIIVRGDMILASSARNSSLQLCEWLEHLYWLLLSKFSLYFYDILAAQCTTADAEHTVSAIKAQNFIHSFNSFHRKSDATFIALIVNGTSSSDPALGVGYGLQRIEGGSEGELKRKFPVLFKTGTDKSEFERLFPSLSILIQEASEANLPNDRIKYFYDARLLKTFFVLLVEYNIYMALVFPRKLAERDGAVVNFMMENGALLRCAKACQSLRGISK
ncbi:UPF0536 protein C12orf66 -like protein [Toxocara canis]|uniref:UPF0536 protein C12orf66-like protein n=1 Tax=Toxocara canis TaxID=6265 RepID=A0A0B2V583_TOXCA|nr:UPF0536 protein C12orf66 -like protein [Toxocara canis]